jgi:hypothetical protein
MTTEQAIRIFDDHLVFLAGRKMINNVMLEKLKTALQTIAESQSYQAEAQAKAEYNATAETITKMRMLLMCCGLTAKGIEHHLKKPVSYTERMAMLTRNKGFVMNSELGATLFEMYERNNRQISECDVQTISSYRFAKTMKLSEIIKTLRNLWPDLHRWFDQVDAGTEINEREIYNCVYEKHLEEIK